MNQPRHEPLTSRPLPRSMFFVADDEDEGFWGCDEHQDWGAVSDEDAEAHAKLPHATP